MKRKTNISVRDNLGARITADMIVGKDNNGYRSGDILDANAVVLLIRDYVGSGLVGENSIGSQHIIDGTIKQEDLSDEIKNKLSDRYDEDEETLYTGGFKNN